KIIINRTFDLLHSPSSSDLSLLNKGFEGSSLTPIMYSLGRLQLHHQPSHLPLTHTSSSFPKQSSLSIRPNPSLKYPSLKASSSSSSKPQNFILIPLQKSAPFRFLKSTCITLTTAAALLHLKPPAIAAPLTPPNTMEEKEQALEEQLAAHPRNVDTLRSLMEVNFRSGEFTEAIKLTDRLIKLEPDEPKWLVQKAKCFLYSGDTESAKTVYQEILAKDPLRPEAHHGLCMAYSDEGLDWEKVECRIEEAMLSCKKENNRHKEHRGFKLLMAQIRVVRGKHSEALKLYEELAEEEPGDFWPYFCQGAIYTLLKKEDKAEEQYLKFKKLVPENYNYIEDFLVNNLFAGEFFSAMERRSGEFNGGLGGGSES
ncbi:unnamed protein product, partial [Brassica oleracea]